MKLLEILKGSSNNDDIDRRKNGVNKVLNAPVHLGALAATLEAQVEQIKSIWVTTRDDAMVIYIFEMKLFMLICILYIYSIFVFLITRDSHSSNQIIYLYILILLIIK